GRRARVRSGQGARRGDVSRTAPAFRGNGVRARERRRRKRRRRLDGQAGRPRGDARSTLRARALQRWYVATRRSHAMPSTKKRRARNPARKPRTPSLHTTRFPGENARYRSARDTLLRSEMKLRRQIEAVAAERRTLPLGGEVAEDYTFQSADGPVR